MKTKDEMIDVVKQWYVDIADLRQKYQVVCVMKDNAGKTRLRTMAKWLCRINNQFQYDAGPY